MNATNPDAKALARISDDIDNLGLSSNLVELESQGFTTIKGVLSGRTIKRAQTAILYRVEKDTGKRVDPLYAKEEDWEGMLYIPYMLYDNPVFEEILLEAKPLAMIRYLLGDSCVLSSLGCHFKGPGGDAVTLHSDNGNGMPSPFPSYSQVANVNYALTPYSKEAGSLAIVPSTHRLARQPVGSEMLLHGSKANSSAIAMDLEPGDAVIWHGNTWHGSFRREIPGIRMNLAVYFARQYLQTQEQHKGATSEAFLKRHANNKRMLRLLGSDQPYGWREDGPDYELMARNPRGLFD